MLVRQAKMNTKKTVRWSIFDPQAGRHFGPMLGQNRLQNNIKINWVDGADFGASWGRFWDPLGLQNRLQNRS